MTAQTQAWNMKIAMLGSTGFLGTVLLEKALNAGYQVRTLVRNPAKLGHCMTSRRSRCGVSWCTWRSDFSKRRQSSPFVAPWSLRVWF